MNTSSRRHVCRTRAGAGFAVFLAESPSDGGNLLTKDSLDSLWELDARILKLEVRFRNARAAGGKSVSSCLRTLQTRSPAAAVERKDAQTLIVPRDAYISRTNWVRCTTCRVCGGRRVNRRKRERTCFESWPVTLASFPNDLLALFDVCRLQAATRSPTFATSIWTA